MPVKLWDETVVEMLKKRPEEIPDYLNACAEEGPETFLSGLRDAIEAKRGGLFLPENRVDAPGDT